MRNQMRKAAGLLLTFGVLWTAANAQECDVGQQIAAAIAMHRQAVRDASLGEVMHGKKDPLRLSDSDRAILIGPFRFGGVSHPSDVPAPAAR